MVVELAEEEDVVQQQGDDYFWVQLLDGWW